MKTAASLLALTQEGFLDAMVPSPFKAKFFASLAYNILPCFLAYKNSPKQPKKSTKTIEDTLRTEKEGIVREMSPVLAH